MKGIVYQLKNIRRDKLCILSFLLPVLVGLAINLLPDMSFSAIGETSFGIVRSDMTAEAAEWLEMNGRVTVYDKFQELCEAVNDPSTQIIGVLQEKETIQTILSGDEFQIYRTIAEVLPGLYAGRAAVNTVTVDLRPSLNNNEWLTSFLVVITMVTAMFMGCTFNAMSIIEEKEDGISFINEIMPMTQKNYIFQKVILGFAGGMLSTLITAIVCMPIDRGQIVPLMLLIVLSSFISAFAGLLIGRFAGGMMAGIAYIKIIMILFIAPPILFYLMFPSDSIFLAVSYLVPSSAAFYGLMDLINGQLHHLGAYLAVLSMHCIALIGIYLILGYSKKSPLSCQRPT